MILMHIYWSVTVKFVVQDLLTTVTNQKTCFVAMFLLSENTVTISE